MKFDNKILDLTARRWVHAQRDGGFIFSPLFGGLGTYRIEDQAQYRNAIALGQQFAFGYYLYALLLLMSVVATSVGWIQAETARMGEGVAALSATLWFSHWYWRLKAFLRALIPVVDDRAMVAETSGVRCAQSRAVQMALFCVALASWTSVIVAPISAGPCFEYAVVVGLLSSALLLILRIVA